MRHASWTWTSQRENCRGGSDVKNDRRDFGPLHHTGGRCFDGAFAGRLLGLQRVWLQHVTDALAHDQRGSRRDACRGDPERKPEVPW